MLEFTKSLFVKNRNGLTFDKYDLTQEVYNIEKNYKITQGTMYGMCGLSMVFYTGVATLLPWENANPFSLFIVFPLLISLIYMLGTLTGFIGYDLCKPLLNKFSIFKRVNQRNDIIKETLTQLCEDEYFQFSLLSYLNAIRNSLDNFTFPIRKEDKERGHASYDIGTVISNLKYYFAQKDYQKAVKYLMEYESIEKIQKALIIEKKLILKGNNLYDHYREAAVRSKNLDTYEDAFNNFMEKPKAIKNSKLEDELESEVEIRKYF